MTALSLGESGRLATGAGRRLSLLKAWGFTPDPRGMFLLPQDTPRLIVKELDELCGIDGRFDYKYAGDE